MIKFITVYPEWIIRQCEINQTLTGKTPIIICSQVSYDLLCQYEREKHKGRLQGYKVIIDDSYDIGVCEIITEGE